MKPKKNRQTTSRQKRWKARWLLSVIELKIVLVRRAFARCDSSIHGWIAPGTHYDKGRLKEAHEGVPFFESKNESFRYVGPGAISNDSEFCFHASCRYGPWNVSLGSRVGIRSTWLRSLPSRLQIIFGQQYHFVVEIINLNETGSAINALLVYLTPNETLDPKDHIAGAWRNMELIAEAEGSNARKSFGVPVEVMIIFISATLEQGYAGIDQFLPIFHPANDHLSKYNAVPSNLGTVDVHPNINRSHCTEKKKKRCDFRENGRPFIGTSSESTALYHNQPFDTTDLSHEFHSL
ncbi:hypothetical protein L208DRAFT_1378262 [Tricholoma matsutake]|nr:hypothetical protein L208DRAFT_1378262 [Tricholoma matsutake 945]